MSREALNVLLRCPPAETASLVEKCRTFGPVRRVRYDPVRQQLSLMIPASSPVRWQINTLIDELGEPFRAASWFDLHYEVAHSDSGSSVVGFLDGLKTFGDEISAEIDPESIPELIAQHAEFLAAGGGGGRWETTSFASFTFASYIGPEVHVGKQFSLAFQELPELHLHGVDLSYGRCNALSCEQLSIRDSNLRGSIWVDGALPGADFSGSDLSGADLSRCDLSGANLSHCNLTGADLENADLTGADLTGAKVANVHWHGVDRSAIKGLGQD